MLFFCLYSNFVLCVGPSIARGIQLAVLQIHERALKEASKKRGKRARENRTRKCTNLVAMCIEELANWWRQSRLRLRRRPVKLRTRRRVHHAGRVSIAAIAASQAVTLQWHTIALFCNSCPNIEADF